MSIVNSKGEKGVAQLNGGDDDGENMQNEIFLCLTEISCLYYFSETLFTSMPII